MDTNNVLYGSSAWFEKREEQWQEHIERLYSKRSPEQVEVAKNYFIKGDFEK